MTSPTRAVTTGLPKSILLTFFQSCLYLSVIENSCDDRSMYKSMCEFYVTVLLNPHSFTSKIIAMRGSSDLFST